MNIKDKNTIRYIVYARKSSESEDRQIQSLDDQEYRLKRIASNLGLKVIKTYKESKSAKMPDQRPLFNKMVKEIETGKANGILCWQTNRLSRNPIDSAKISWLLQQGVLKSIQTSDKEHTPNDNVLLMSVESGVANQFLIDLSKNVKRGNENKRRNGWRPGTAPIGYLNDKAEHTIIKDPKRFNLIRKCWDCMLAGQYTVPQILDKLNNEWGFRTLKRKRIGGKPLSRSGLYHVFTNIFYTGIIEYEDKEYPGRHDKMITLEEFDRVQMLLGRDGRPRPKKHKFDFTGLIRCKECGCFYTAEKKKKFIKCENKIRFYTYYHCTRRKRDIDCSQRKTIRRKELNKQIEEEIEKYTILPQFRDWALEILKERDEIETRDKSAILESQERESEMTQKELKNLTKMRARELIDDEEYITTKNELKQKLSKIKGQFKDDLKEIRRWQKMSEETFNFAAYARHHFDEGSPEAKREILMGIGQNPEIINGKLSIDEHVWLEPIAKYYPPLEQEYRMLEPRESGMDKAQTEAIASVRTKWQAR